MPSVRNFNYVDVPSVSVLVQSTVRPLELKQYYPPWTREYGDRPALGFAYPSPVIPVIVVQQADRLAMQSTILRTDNIFNTNRFNTPVAVANNSSTKLFTSGTVVQPVLASSGYGNGTISDVTASVTSYGANVWTFNLSNLSTTRSLSNGKVITSAPETGRFSSTVVVDSVISSTSISCIASGATAPIEGLVRTVQDSGRLFELNISSVTAISATEWSLTISGIFDSSVFLFGDEISVVTGSGNLGSLGTGNTVYVTDLPNANQITCKAINGSAAPTVGKISSLSKTGVNIPFTPDGENEYTTPGTYTWTAPAGVTSVSVVAVGGGGGGGSQWSSGGGGGGGLGWKNNIAVTPGQSYTVTVGAGGPSLSNATNAGSEGGNSFFISLATVAGYGGGRGGPGSNATANGRGGGFVGDGGGRGGDGGWDGNWFKGGAGAGGYSGNGADSGTSTGTAAPAGSGAGAAGGYYSSTFGVPAGGGVGIYGRGADGAARGQFFGGGGGSGGTNGTGGEASGESGFKTIAGGRFGGGGGGSGTSYGGGPGGSGAVRIVWGPDKAFPTTNVFSTGSQTQTTSLVWYDSTIISVPSLLTTPRVNKQLFRQNAISENKTVITNSTVKPSLTSRNSVTAQATVDRFPNTGDFSVVGSYQNSFSTYFDGSGDYIRTAGLVLNNSAFTISFYFYPITSSVIGLFDSAPGQVSAFRNYPANTIQDQNGGSVAFTPLVNQWNWMSIVGDGTNFTVYLNGSSVGSAAYASLADSNFTIGTINSGGDGTYTGYISNFRIKNIAAVDNVPTTPLTAIANTSLLTCNTQLIVDQSPNAFTITKFGDVKYSLFQPFPSMAVGSQGHSVTQVKILGVSSFNQTSVPLLTISDSVYSDRFTRQTNDNIGNEATESVLVYIQDTVINDSNKLKWIITNTVNSGYISKSSVVTVNANKIPDSYVRPILSNAFSITTANKPIALSRHVSSFSNLAATATVFGQSLLETWPQEPITKTITIDSIVTTQVRTIITAAQGVTLGLSKSFTLAPYGTAGALVIGEGGLLVSAQTEFWS